MTSISAKGKATRDDAFVAEQINDGNPWYTERQSSSKYLLRRRHKLKLRQATFISILETLKPTTGKLSILDAGCGDGLNLEMLSRIPFLEVYGCDYNPRRVEVASKRFPNCTVFKADLIKPESFPSKKFDIIFNCHVIEHIYEDRKVINNFWDLLTPGGKLLLATPNEGCRLAQIYKWFFSEEEHATSDHVQFYTDKSIRTKLFGDHWETILFQPESFYPPHPKLAALVSSSAWGSQLLQKLGNLVPSQCAGLIYLLAKKTSV